VVYLTWEWTESRQLPEGGDRQELHVDSLTLDGTDTEQYETTAEATEHPIEDLAAVTDHVRPGLHEFTLGVIVSSRPVDEVLAEDDHRVETVRETLARLVAEGRELTVETDTGEWVGYLLLSASESRDAMAGGEAGRWQLRFREIRRASVETVTAPSPRVERARRPASADGEGEEGDLDGQVQRATDSLSNADWTQVSDAVLGIIGGGS
jgi:hypothetical protein